MRNAADTVNAGPMPPDERYPVRSNRLQALFASIAAAPWRWTYFQVLRLLDCLNPGLPRLGQARRPADEPVRLGQEPALDFAPASLARLVPGHGAVPPRISSTPCCWIWSWPVGWRSRVGENRHGRTWA